MESFLAFWKKVWQGICAGLWNRFLKKTVVKMFRLHWIPTLLLVIASVVLLVYAFALPDANPIIAYAGYFVSAYTLAVVCVSMPKLIKSMKKGLYSNAYSQKFLTDKKLRTEFFCI